MAPEERLPPGTTAMATARMCNSTAMATARMWNSTAMPKERLTFIWPENNGTVFCGHAGATQQHNIYRSHGTDDWQLLATTSGRGRVGSVNGSFEVTPGDVLLMRPGVLHDYGPRESIWEYDWVHFQPRQEWLDLLGWPEHAPGLMHLRLLDDELRANVMSALARTLVSYPYHRQQLFIMNALEEALLWCDLLNPLSRGSRLDPRLHQVVTYLQRNLSDKITLASLAEIAGMSVSRLSHLFSEHTGMGPIQYLDIQRLEYARHLLENTDLPITRIAGDVGLDLRNFSARFKQYTTLNPRDYRKRAAKALPSTKTRSTIP